MISKGQKFVSLLWLVGTILLSSFQVSYSQNTTISIDEWDAYPSLRTIPFLGTVNNQIWYRAPYALFTIDDDLNVVEKITTKDRLYYGSVSAFEAVASNEIYAGFTDGMLSVYDGEKIQWIDPINRSDLYVSKSINHIDSYNSALWISTDFGIVVMDRGSKRVIESYSKLGELNRGERVSSVAFSSDSIYAATASGLAAASKNEELQLSQSWNIYGSSNGINEESLEQVYLIDGRPYVISEGGTCYYRTNNGWSIDNQWDNSEVSKVIIVNDDIYATANNSVLKGAKQNIGSNVAATQIFDSFFEIDDIRILSNELYISVRYAGVYKKNLTTQSEQRILINSPYLDLVGDIAIQDSIVSFGTTRSAGGEVRDQAKGFEIINSESKRSVNVNYYVNPQLRESQFYLVDQVSIHNDEIWSIAYGHGVGRYSLNDQSFVSWNADNSALEGVEFDPDFLAYTDISTTDEGVYVMSYRGSDPIYYKEYQGSEWNSIPKFNQVPSQSYYYEHMVHSNGIHWVSLRSDFNTGRGLLVTRFNEPTTSSDDEGVLLSDRSGDGNLPDIKVNSMVEDLNNEVWIGTDRGVAKFRFPDFILSGGTESEAEWLINSDTSSSSPYLLRDVHVTDITINAANQKWIATVNAGLWLLNEEGSEVLYHLTKDNAPIPSNSINSVASDNQTGNVYIGTSVGLMKFKETARKAAETSDELLVYPNPFEYQLHGDLTIDEIEAPATVHILSSGGRKVDQFKANSSRVEWSPRTKNGNKLASGVYIVLALGDNGNRQSAKIVIIR